jgi:hypothetical protein
MVNSCPPRMVVFLKCSSMCVFKKSRLAFWSKKEGFPIPCSFICSIQNFDTCPAMYSICLYVKKTTTIYNQKSKPNNIIN